MSDEKLIATERLRALLGEHGVEWRRTPHYSSESMDNETVFCGIGIEWLASDHLNGRLGLRALKYEVTPEQAVEATLGPAHRKTHTTEYCDRCDGAVLPTWKKCPWCGEPLEEGGRMSEYVVELPQSADGYVWTGREACFWTGPANEDWHKFDGLHYADGMWCVEDVDFERYPAVSVWYERPDGLERIADDIEESKGTGFIDDSTICGWADRIRKLAAKGER